MRPSANLRSHKVAPEPKQLPTPGLTCWKFIAPKTRNLVSCGKKFKQYLLLVQTGLKKLTVITAITGIIHVLSYTNCSRFCFIIKYCCCWLRIFLKICTHPMGEYFLDFYTSTNISTHHGHVDGQFPQACLNTSKIS